VANRAPAVQSKKSLRSAKKLSIDIDSDKSVESRISHNHMTAWIFSPVPRLA
jgi:hypothetical protein